jgi:NADH-quinone oxidoreductase subunit L
MLIGMMALWSGLGTFAFGDVDRDGNGTIEPAERGIFSLVRPAERDHALTTPDGLVWAAAQEELVRWRQAHPEATGADAQRYARAQLPGWRDGGTDGTGQRYGYGWLTLAGIGIFCGCVGKSAQFPLHVWLPDAMEGPTPVSALVHSATMVAAGVYLVGRFYAVFTAEALLVIAVTGAVTLFLAATIAITATDIKRVLAYSTVSQLGYMMLALGVGGWLAGMLHLVTHACFKSLLFLCSGSVIHAVHSNDLRVMGGLWRKMPITAITMLIGCVAIAGLGIPLVIGLSGYYSKDLILEQALSFAQENGGRWAGLFFLVAAGGAAITAFYMFRLWFLAFAGQPRDAHRHGHAHESPRVMYVPLVLLALCAVGAAWELPGSDLSVAGLLEQARPTGTAATLTGVWVPLAWPSEHVAHAASSHGTIVVPAVLVAFATAVAGLALAVAMYVTGWLQPAEVSRQFAPVYRLFWNKWWFDELYAWGFVRPVGVLARLCAACDTGWIDRCLDALARGTCRVAVFWEQLADRRLIDGPVDRAAGWTYALGLSLRRLQTGNVRQYILFLVVGVVVVFLISSLFL